MKLRSVGAVVAGVGANFLAVVLDGIMHASGVFPPLGQDMGDGLFALALAYRTVCAVGGGWVTARLAPFSPVKHALILGGVGMLLSSLGAAAQWNLGHHWYPLSLIAICLPASWAGATLANRS
ncbi:MAG: hypothetical protein HY904_12075 [Deltaproteobacteria bacterium]|nr:hypothetical protein [Deltaproteobacteria bacterium]